MAAARRTRVLPSAPPSYARGLRRVGVANHTARPTSITDLLAGDHAMMAAPARYMPYGAYAFDLKVLQ